MFAGGEAPPSERVEPDRQRDRGKERVGHDGGSGHEGAARHLQDGSCNAGEAL